MQIKSFAAIVALILVPAVASARPAKKPAAFVATVSLADARTTALARIPGVVTSDELEKEGGRWIYSFLIDPTAGKAGWVKEVNVDATTGTVVNVEDERRVVHRPAAHRS